MDELISSFKAQMYDKARSPFLTAFAFSWASWNLKTIIIIFSSGETDQKLKLISYLYPNLTFYFMQWVAYPLVSASLFIVLYPLIALVAFSYWNFLNNKIKHIQVTQDDKVPTSAEDARKLRKLISDVSIEKQKIIDDLVEKNSELMVKDASTNDLIAKLESEKRDLSKGIEHYDQSLIELNKLNSELQGKVDELTREKREEFANSIAAADEEVKLATLIKELNLKMESLENFDKESITRLLKLIVSFKEKHNINTEQFRLLALLITSEGKEDISRIKNAMRIDDLKANAIISTLQRKKLVSFDPIFSDDVALSTKFNDEIYQSGILSIQDYLLILDSIFLEQY